MIWILKVPDNDNTVKELESFCESKRIGFQHISENTWTNTKIAMKIAQDQINAQQN